MKTKIKYTLLKRSKKYNYKVYEEQSYDIMSGCQYSYLITKYNTDDIIMSGLTNWCEVEENIKKLKEMN